MALFDIAVDPPVLWAEQRGRVGYGIVLLLSIQVVTGAAIVADCSRSRWLLKLRIHHQQANSGWCHDRGEIRRQGRTPSCASLQRDSVKNRCVETKTVIEFRRII